MEQIHLFTDSCADIPKDQMKRHKIEVLPFTIAIGRTLYREHIDINTKEYCEILRRVRRVPVTNALSVDAFYNYFQQRHHEGDTHLLGVLISSGGSFTYQNACIARDMFYKIYGEDDLVIELFDSESYGYLYGQIVVELAAMRESGAEFAALCQRARERIGSVEAIMGVYHLRYLRQSGRITNATTTIGDLFGVKPICHIYRHIVSVYDRVYGAAAVVPRMIDAVTQRIHCPERQNALLLFGDVADKHIYRAETLLRERIDLAGVVCLPLGPSVLTNTGPETLAIGFYGHPDSRPLNPNCLPIAQQY